MEGKAATVSSYASMVMSKATPMTTPSAWVKPNLYTIHDQTNITSLYNGVD